MAGRQLRCASAVGTTPPLLPNAAPRARVRPNATGTVTPLASRHVSVIRMQPSTTAFTRCGFSSSNHSSTSFPSCGNNTRCILGLSWRRSERHGSKRSSGVLLSVSEVLLWRGITLAVSSRVFVSASSLGRDSDGRFGGGIRREVLSKEGRTKLDANSDRDFYAFPRFVTHVDTDFLSTLTQLFRERLPRDGEVLDLMSSWVSHLPSDVEYKRVVGHGLNAAELARNPRFSYFFVKDLNRDPKLEASDQSFDAVICTVSVQYMQQPEKVFSEIYRVLRPGGVVIVSFSNRMFYGKAIAAWRDGTGYSRVQLVKQYFGCIQGFTEPEVVTELESSPTRSQPSIVSPLTNFLSKLGKLLKRSSKDPFYAVVAYRNFKPIRED